ncbi:hypothetical protein [Streptomyces sp. NPDC002265]|uniref:hypothetical protein n=1 Tax=Streptomyces sp. NPDC002265 TaxID=3154415 RepID=UPI003318AFFE
MSGQADPVHHGQALALTLAVLLLTDRRAADVLLDRPDCHVHAVAVLVVAAYTAPGLARCLAVRRAVRRLLRALPGA